MAKTRNNNANANANANTNANRYNAEAAEDLTANNAKKANAATEAEETNK